MVSLLDCRREEVKYDHGPCNNKLHLIFIFIMSQHEEAFLNSTGDSKIPFPAL